MIDVRPQQAAPTRAPVPSTKSAIGGGLGAAALPALSLAVTAIKPDEGKRNAAYLDIARTPTIADGPQQLAAATRLAFKIGKRAYCHSGSASAFRRGDGRTCCDLMLAWVKARVRGQLVPVPGLAARRQRERAMCMIGKPLTPEPER